MDWQAADRWYQLVQRFLMLGVGVCIGGMIGLKVGCILGFVAGRAAS